MRSSDTLYIIYKGTDPSNDSNIDLNALGKSLLGFNRSIEQILKIGGIKGDIEIKATHVGNGSILIELGVFIANNIPFDSIQDYFDFLNFADQGLYNEVNGKLLEVQGFMVEVKNGGKSILNKQVTENIGERAAGGVIGGVAYDILKSARKKVTGKFISKMFSWGKTQKGKITIKDQYLGDIPQKYAHGLHKMVNNKKFNKAVSPFIENEFKSINITYDKNIKESIINSDNFYEYMGDAKEILPELDNGKVITIEGKITNYLSSKGDYMKIQIPKFPKSCKLLQLYPPENSDTSQYINYYKKYIRANVEVVRLSKYQKPKLKLKEVEFITDLFGESTEIIQ